MEIFTLSSILAKLPSKEEGNSFKKLYYRKMVTGIKYIYLMSYYVARHFKFKNIIRSLKILIQF